MRNVLKIDLPQVTYNVQYFPGRVNPFVAYKMDHETAEWEIVAEYADFISCMHCLTSEIR